MFYSVFGLERNLIAVADSATVDGIRPYEVSGVWCQAACHRPEFSILTRERNFNSAYQVVYIRSLPTAVAKAFFY